MVDDDRPWLPEEAAEWFRVSVPTIRRWVDRGRLRRTAPDGAMRITARSVRELSEGYDAPDGQGQGSGDDHADSRQPRGAEAVARGRDDGRRSPRVANGAQRAGGGARPGQARGSAGARPRPDAPDPLGVPPFLGG